jgi:hypothetical protein
MPTSIVVLQRRREGGRADELLDQLQTRLAPGERIRWSENGHAHLESSRELEEARRTVADKLARIDGAWTEHIQIL